VLHSRSQPFGSLVQAIARAVHGHHMANHAQPTQAPSQQAAPLPLASAGSVGVADGAGAQLSCKAGYMPGGGWLPFLGECAARKGAGTHLSVEVEGERQ
jgi:hypothetical protein